MCKTLRALSQSLQTSPQHGTKVFHPSFPHPTAEHDAQPFYGGPWKQ